MAKLFDAVQRFRKIEEVTSSKDDAPPVYLMDEIVELAKEGNESAQSVAEHIQRNLQHKNPIVKWKALKLIRHLCNKGCTQFQRCMQRYSGNVRELVNYRGEPDPFKGDAPNQRVREMAKEVIELLYGPVSHQSTAHTTPNLQGRIQGFGSGMPAGGGTGGGYSGGYSGGGSSAAGGGGSSRMMAFGSNSSPAELNRGFMGNQQTTHNHSRSGSLGEPVLGVHRSGNSGSGLHSSLNSGGGGSFGPPQYSSSRTPAAPAAPAASRLGGSTGLAARITEESLVADMCAGGGLRPTPSSEDLRAFVQSVSNMDGLKIAELMIPKLRSDQWQVQLRTLCALEAILDQGMTQACGEVAVMFQSDPSPVQAAAQSKNTQVRQQAVKCYKMLTGEDVEPVTQAGSVPTATTNASKPAAAAPAAFDLLGDLDVPAAPMPAAAQPAPTATAPAAPTSAATQQDPFALLASLTATADPVGAVPAVPSAGLPGNTPITAAAVPAAQQSAPVNHPPLDDFFSSMSIAPSPMSAMAATQMVQPVPAQAALLGGGPTNMVQQHDLLGGGPASPMNGFAAQPGMFAGGQQMPGPGTVQAAHNAGFHMSGLAQPMAGMGQMQMPGQGGMQAGPGLSMQGGMPQGQMGYGGMMQAGAQPSGVMPGMGGVAGNTGGLGMPGYGMTGGQLGMGMGSGMGVRPAGPVPGAGVGLSAMGMNGKPATGTQQQTDAAFDFVKAAFK